MRGTEYTVQRPITFEIEECCNCGVLFAMTAEFAKDRHRRKEAASFYCPNGHAQHYMGKTDAQKLREAEAALSAERDQRLAAERELRRIGQRAKGGACPCCKRTFVQLSRHMKAKHPDYPPAAS